MKRPFGHTAIAAFAILYCFYALFAVMNTGDLFVRLFLVLATIAAAGAGHAVWRGHRNSARLVALWSIATVLLAAAVFIYSRYFALREGDEPIAAMALLIAAVVGVAAAYLHRQGRTVSETQT